MDKDLASGLATYGGAMTTACSAPAALTSESIMLIILSAAGIVISAFGLIYTVWNSNRSHQLQKQELELKRLELARHEDQRHIQAAQ